MRAKKSNFVMMAAETTLIDTPTTSIFRDQGSHIRLAEAWRVSELRSLGKIGG
jgi:hypothetical protein